MMWLTKTPGGNIGWLYFVTKLFDSKDNDTPSTSTEYLMRLIASIESCGWLLSLEVLAYNELDVAILAVQPRQITIKPPTLKVASITQLFS